ncbi:MAG: DUF6504 family protein [Mobilicoccus sp.]|nr:DUF6504 family protein [Mobilicoccus sp.]
MRRYDEQVQVQTEADEPRRFRWQGRIYEIDAVLDRWVMRLPWWRRALAPDGGTWALDPRLLDEQVWRVSAVGRGGAAGIYDLTRGAHWRLARIGD